MNLNKANILFFTTETYPSFAGDGRNALLFASFINNLGYNTSLICLNPNGILKSEEVVNGVKVYRIFYYYRIFLFRAITRVLMILKILKLRKDFNYWVIYGGMPCHKFTIVFGRLLGKKVIFRSTLWGFDDIISLCSSRFHLIECFNKHLYCTTTAYFALNETFKTTWIDYLKASNPIFLSTQGVDCALYSINTCSKYNFREKFGYKNDEFIVLLQGHLIKRKGFAEIFDWLSMVDFNIKVIHVGRCGAPNWDIVSTKNHEMADLMDYGKSLLGDNLLFLGETNNVAQYMAIADAFILNSDCEGFPPNSLSEAMASGLPSLVRRMEGINTNTIIDGETVMLYSDFEEFKKKLQLLVMNKINRKRIGDNARNMMLKYNDISFVTQNFIQFIETNLA